MYSMRLLSRNIAVICGNDTNIRKVKSYNLQTGAELSSLNLKGACGVAGVKLGEKMVLAVSRRLVKIDIGFMIIFILLIIKFKCYLN